MSDRSCGSQTPLRVPPLTPLAPSLCQPNYSQGGAFYLDLQ
jgi:hypothetical protein